MQTFLYNFVDIPHFDTFVVPIQYFYFRKVYIFLQTFHIFSFTPPLNRELGPTTNLTPLVILELTSTPKKIKHWEHSKSKSWQTALFWSEFAVQGSVVLPYLMAVARCIFWLRLKLSKLETFRSEKFPGKEGDKIKSLFVLPFDLWDWD